MENSGELLTQNLEAVPRKELSPQEKYEIMVGRYVGFMDRIRGMERMHRPTDEIAEVDKKRNEIHRQILSLGESMGKGKDDVYLDFLSKEGNLMEYGIDVPVIRLPIIGIYFRYDIDKNKVSSKGISQDNNQPTYYLENPDGEMIAIKDGGRYGSGGDKHKGDLTLFERWEKKPFCAVVFKMNEDVVTIGMGSTPFALPLSALREERMRNLARDFGLNIFMAHDTQGHQDYTGRTISGVEVPMARIDEIGSAMNSSPAKYWLTSEELADPYNEEYLRMESPHSLIQYGAALRENIVADNSWLHWNNILRISKVGLSQKKNINSQYFAYGAKTYFFPEAHYLDGKNTNSMEKYNEALENLKTHNSQKAEELEALKGEVDVMLQKTLSRLR